MTFAVAVRSAGPTSASRSTVTPSQPKACATFAQLGLSIDTVTRRIRAENVNLSGGRLEPLENAWTGGGH